jgi:hypothetical protein
MDHGWPIGVLCALLVSVFPVRGEAAPCQVISSATEADVPGTLPTLLAAVARGECRSNDKGIRDHYKPYLYMAQEFHVIEWAKSMDLYLEAPLASLQGSGGRPLIVRVRDGAHVRLIGKKLAAAGTITIAGDTGVVILDGLTMTGFDGTALQVDSDRNTILKTRILGSGQPRAESTPLVQAIAGVVVHGRHTKIVDSEIADHRGPGLLVTEDPQRTNCATLKHRNGEGTTIRGTFIHDNGGSGALLNAFDITISQSRIARNARHGVYLQSESIAAECAAVQGAPLTPMLWHTAKIAETRFWQNGGTQGDAIAVSAVPLPPPVDLVAVSPDTATEIVLLGNVSRFPDPAYVWNDQVLNFDTLRIELFLHDGSATAGAGEGMHFLLSSHHIDPQTRQFTLHIPKTLLVVDGQPVETPTFTATLVDDEYGNTSPFSAPLDVAATADWDGDGLLNFHEDHNHNGLVDGEETNPRLNDSDGDGLTDGEERNLIGHVDAVITGKLGSARVVLSRPQGLDPRNPDSDGDCLPDGLEMRVGESDLPAWQPVVGSVLQRPRMAFSPACLQNFRDDNLLLIPNALPWDPTEAASPENVTAIYDTDLTSWTDPTNPDTDRDGVSDGEEDWNIDGARTAAPTAVTGAVETLVQSTPTWIETDASLYDSDADGLADGEEGDRDGDGVLGPEETNPLSADSDGDGVMDADETKKYGTQPNACDTDGDRLSDGLETGTLNPYPDDPACRGLQTAGSNFESIGALNPVKADSDNDGLADGQEDSNYNGWLDAGETDPTVKDTDGDGLSDYVEMLGDLDQDGIVDVALAHIDNGGSCAPPPTFADLDCDGLPNTRDNDSDNDGCSDRDEGIAPAGDPHGIPAAFNAQIKRCGGGSGGSAPASPNVGAGGGDHDEEEAPIDAALAKERAIREYYSTKIDGGGSCSLIMD